MVTSTSLAGSDYVKIADMIQRYGERKIEFVSMVCNLIISGQSMKLISLIQDFILDDFCRIVIKWLRKVTYNNLNNLISVASMLSERFTKNTYIIQIGGKKL